jgi:hypothetical protein
MSTTSHDLHLPRPEDDVSSLAAGPDQLPSLRTRMSGRAPRVLVWLVVLGAAAYGVDLVAELNLLPPAQSLLPWIVDEGPAARQVSAEQIVAATNEIDRALEERLRGKGVGTPTSASAIATTTTITTTRNKEREVAEGVKVEGTIHPLENPRALDRFYAALRRTALREPGALTRITHYGDSIIIEDLWTSTVRRRLQERFGDGGPGFLFLARPWEWYGRLDVVLKFTDAWHFYRVTIGQVRDALYGYGGVSFVAAGPGSKATYATTTEGTTGRAVSRFEVYFLAQPGGGKVEVAVDDAVAATFSTDAAQVGSGYRLVEMPDGPHTIVTKSVGGGPVRLFGVTMEREGPGVVYDGIGLLGASARALLEPDEAHWKEQFAHRRPDLVVLTFGTNESDHDLSLIAYREQLGRVVARIRAVAPFASCLLVGPPDRGDPNTHQTRSIIPKIVGIQRDVALAGGCAFWDTYAAMGGKDTMWHWYRANPRRAFGDLTHLAPPGGEILGDLLHGALLQGFLEYLDRRSSSGQEP